MSTGVPSKRKHGGCSISTRVAFARRRIRDAVPIRDNIGWWFPPPSVTVEWVTVELIKR